MRQMLVWRCVATAVLAAVTGCGGGRTPKTAEKEKPREALKVDVDVRVNVGDRGKEPGVGVVVTATPSADVAVTARASAVAATAAPSEIARAAANGPGRIELKLDLPKEQFTGTPTPINIANLDTAQPAQRPPFLLPEGAVNLARGKSVTSSEAFPLLGELAMVTDGDKEGRDGSYVELGPGKQWVQIDLGERCEIFAVVLWLYHAQRRAYHDVVVQVGDDAGMAGAKVIYNNDHDNSSGFGVGTDLAFVESYMGRIIDAQGVMGRYVRINSRGNTSDEMNHFTEVEVYGRAVK